MIEHIEGDEIVHMIEGFAGAMMSFADQAEHDGVRAVEITARDAAVALLALLDVLAGPAREVLANP